MVERFWNYFRAGKRKDPSGLVKSRIFNPSGLARIQQRHCTDQYRVLPSADDHNLVWETARPSKIAQVSCDCLAQIGVATIRRMAQQVGSLFGENLCPETFPNGDWEFVNCGNAGDQRDTWSSIRRPEIELFSSSLIRNCCHALGNARWPFNFRKRFQFACAKEGFRKRVCHECSGAGLRLNIAFRMKFREGKLYGGP